MGKLVVVVLPFLCWLQAVGVRVQLEEEMNQGALRLDTLGPEPAAEVALVAEGVQDGSPRDEGYWLETGALERCRKGRVGRFIKQAVGIPVGAVVAGPVMVVSGLIYLAPMFDSFTDADRAWNWIAYWISVAAIPAAMSQSQSITNVGIEQLSGMLGASGHHPACCCKEDVGCALMGSTHLEKSQKQVSCPSGWEHDATQCAAPEVLTYENKTVSGCVCMEGLEGCAGNKLESGHAWCEVEDTAACGFKFRSRKKRIQGGRWDYCRFAQSGMFEDGSVAVNNTALSAFVPNVHSRISKFFNKNPWTSKTWVDGHRGVAVGRRFPGSQCFAGIPVETLDGCAQKCLEEGAPNAKAMEGEEETGRPWGAKTVECKAMAYNRQTRLCVRLPSFASDADFTPYITSLDSKGWQNFKRGL